MDTGARDSRRLALVVGAPAAGMAVAAVVLVALGLAGANPLWPRTETTFSEAAALRDQATVVRLLEGGANQDVRYPVRAGLISDEPLELTPMEAAIRENRSEMVDLLVTRRAAPPPAATLCAWMAQASARRASDIVSYLRQTYPEPAAACSQAAVDTR
jgi:hypothetical protein